MTDARARVYALPVLSKVFTPEAHPTLAHAYLVQWASLSVQLQEQSERLYVEAGRSCLAAGEQHMAKIMLALAAEAIERYRHIADDARRLVELWNQRQALHLNHTYLLIQPTPDTIVRLVESSEGLISEGRAWALIASQYELDRLYISAGNTLLKFADTLLGPELVSKLQSPRWMAQGKGHSRAALAWVLEHHPSRAGTMIEAGTHLLHEYTEFLSTCAVAALNLGARA